MQENNIGIETGAREVVNETLLQYLSDLQLLFNKMQGFHWNVVSRDFAELHAAFQVQYESVAEAIDEVAERMRMLGAHAPASLALYAERSQLEEANKPLADIDMLKWLLGDHEILCRWLRGAVKVAQEAEDEGTADFYIGQLRWHEKTAWMLRSTIG